MSITEIICDPTPPTIDFTAVKKRQQATWASGDFAVVGTTLQIVGESLCEAVDLRAGEHVLDVAAGNGNASLAAARRFAEVTALDYVPQLLDKAADRAEAEGLPLTILEGDAEHLPFPDGRFDVVLSTYGCMFAPDQVRTARELARVCRPGGRIGLASWTPEGAIGQVFKVVGGHVAPPAGVASPALWGKESRLAELFPGARVRAERKLFAMRYLSAAHWIDVFRRFYGPVYKAYEAVGATGAEALTRDLTAVLTRFDVGGGRTLVVPAEYLEVVIEPS
jgi:SAM-dependent methyltransferase